MICTSHEMISKFGEGNMHFGSLETGMTLRVQGLEFRLSKKFGHGRNHRISRNFGQNLF